MNIAHIGIGICVGLALYILVIRQTRFMETFCEALGWFERESFFPFFLLLTPFVIMYAAFSVVYTTLNLVGVW